MLVQRKRNSQVLRELLYKSAVEQVWTKDSKTRKSRLSGRGSGRTNPEQTCPVCLQPATPRNAVCLNVCVGGAVGTGLHHVTGGEK